MILVTGASGQLGKSVVKHLLTKTSANNIAVLVRDSSKVEDLIKQSVQVREGNYHQPNNLPNAFNGIEKLLLISSNDFNDRYGQHKNVVDAAKQAGVKHILYTGVTMNNIEQSALKNFIGDHYQIEDYIKTTGLQYTFLQNCLYADVLPMFLGEKVVDTGVFFPAGSGKVSFALREDLAEATANILTTSGHENKTYTLSSTQSYSFQDVANILSKLSGKTIPYINPEEAVFKNALEEMGLPQHIIAFSAAFGVAIKNNEFDITDNTLEKTLGRPQTTLETYLQQTFFAAS